MSGRVVWRARAEEDLTAAYLYIGADSPRSAERLLEAVEAAIALLRHNPLAGSPRRFRSRRAQGMRAWSPRGFPNYVLFYRCVADDIEVVRFLHGARDLPRRIDE